jgi:putative membrane protein
MRKQALLAAPFLVAVAFVCQPTFAQDRSTNQPDRALDHAGQAADHAADRAGQAANQAVDSAARVAGARDQANAGSKDQKCAMKIADANQFEIQAGQLAQQKAQSDEIKQFAKMMVDDHTQALQQLQQIAQQKGWQFSQQLMPVHRAMLDELNKLEGQEFEKAYLYGQVAGHTKVALGLRDAKSELQDQELRQYAATILPKVQQHLQHAQQLARADEAVTAGARISGERSINERSNNTGDAKSNTSERIGQDHTGVTPGTTPPPQPRTGGVTDPTTPQPGSR